jgi:hypothetical protein
MYKLTFLGDAFFVADVYRFLQILTDVYSGMNWNSWLESR